MSNDGSSIEIIDWSHGDYLSCTIGVEIAKTHTVQYSVHSFRCISFCAKLHTYYLWSSDPIFILQETNSKNSIKPLTCNHALVMKENMYRISSYSFRP